MGFDIECIPNIQSLAGEYFCPVCRLLVYPNEALQSMCTHLYCKPCLTYVASTSRACPYDGYLVTEADAKPLMETNKMLADTIGKTKVHCLYQKSGCTWLGTLSESSSHCPGCAFGNSLVVCNRCGIQIIHHQVLEHAQVCPGTQQVSVQDPQGSKPIANTGIAVGGDQTRASTQAGAAVTTSQAAPVLNPQGQAVTNPTLEQWNQQLYQHYYQGYSGYFPFQQQPFQSQVQPIMTAGQHQAPHVHQPIKSEPLTQIQGQLQAQCVFQPQSHVVSQAAPASQSQNQTAVAPLSQTYPSVPLLPQFPSQTLPASHGQAQSQPIPQAHSSQPQLQHVQVPQYQQFRGQSQSQLHMQHHVPPSQTSTVRSILPSHPAGQAQALQRPAYFNGHLNHLQPHPNQQSRVGPQINMPVHHQAGNQPTLRPTQMQNLFPRQMSHQRPPQSLFPIQKQQSSVHQEVGLMVHQSQVVQPAQQSMSQQPTLGQSSGVVHNQMHQQGAFTHPPVATQSYLRPQDTLLGIQNYHQTTQLHQPSLQNQGLEPQIIQNSSVGRSDQPAPGPPAVRQGEMKRTENQLPLAPEEHDRVTSRPALGTHGDKRVEDDKKAEPTLIAVSSAGNDVKCTEEETKTRVDAEHKGDGTDGLVESGRKAGEHREMKRETESKQMSIEKAANGLEKPGQSPVIEGRSAEADKPAKKIEKMEKNRDIPHVQVSPGIGSGKNQPQVAHRLLNLQQGARALSGQISTRVPHHMPAPRYPPLILRPHGPEIFPGDGSFKPLPSDRLNPVPLEPSGRRLFEEGFKQIPRPFTVDSDSFRQPGVNRGVDTRFPSFPQETYKIDYDSGPTSRFFKSLNDLQEKQLGHQYIGGPRIPSVVNGTGLGGGRLSVDDHFSSRLGRREFEAQGNLRIGEHLRHFGTMEPDVVPRHIRGGDQFSPHDLPGTSKLEEQVGLNGVPRRPGDPGFRSRYTLQGFPSDGGSSPFKGVVEPFENSRKRKLGATGWCRICKVECESMEGLDFHSQTKDHQKKSMDMVLIIKQKAKKYKLASADCSQDNTIKAYSEGHDSKKKRIA